MDKYVLSPLKGLPKGEQSPKDGKEEDNLTHGGEEVKGRPTAEPKVYKSPDSVRHSFRHPRMGYGEIPLPRLGRG